MVCKFRKEKRKIHFIPASWLDVVHGYDASDQVILQFHWTTNNC